MAAITIVAACVFPDTTRTELHRLKDEVETPVTKQDPKIERAAVLHTARSLFEGEVLIPSTVWSGK